MLRLSASTLALCLVLVAGCDTSTDTADTPPETPEQIDPPETEPDVQLAFTAASSSSAQSEASPRTLSTVPENQDWSILARSPDGRGGFIGLRFGDNGNGDADAFEYDEESGELRLRQRLDYERPIDADGDNKFELQMVAYEYPEAPVIPFALDVVDQKEVFEDFPVVWLIGETTFGGLGRNMSPLGDIDQDGRPDIAVAAPGRHSRDAYSAFPPDDYHPSGELYVVSGEALSKTTLLSFDDGIDAGVWKLSGTDTDLNLGYNITLLGDLDGDEVDDFVFAHDDRSIQIVSGVDLAERMALGLEEDYSGADFASISLEGDAFDHVLSPRSFASLGDLDGDGLPELAFCATNLRFGNTVDAHIFVLSGTALKTVLEAGDRAQISEFYGSKQAAYTVYTGNHSTCGPLTALGDVDGDERVDIAIPMPGPLVDDSGILVYAGAQLLTFLQAGGRQQLSAVDRIFNGLNEPFVHFTDLASQAQEQHYMVTALGDVTGDEIDDFAFSWGRYHTANDSAYVVKGDPELLAENGSTHNLRGMVQGGSAIQLAASSDGLEANSYRVEPIHVLRAPEDGLHETMVFVGAGETRSTLFSSYGVSADNLPAGGTAIVDLPIGGLGTLGIPRENGRQLSYVKNIGDLNTDGYGDFAIGYGVFDHGGAEDSGAVLLVSGAMVVDTINRGEALEPSRMIKMPEE